MLFPIILGLQLCRIFSAYQTNPTPWGCIEYDKEFSPTLPSCLPGHNIHMESVVFESTTDDTCAGVTRCHVEKNDVLNADCDGKRTCQVDINILRLNINATCARASRLYVKYRCLPVIQEQKDYLCEPSSARRVSLSDINLSCPRNYHIYITSAVIGISVKPQDDQSKARFKCNKETQWMCTTSATNVYRDVCQRQVRSGNAEQCKIKYTDRGLLDDCPHGVASNYSMVEYLCVPGESIVDDLQRYDICAIEPSGSISSSRGILSSPADAEALSKSPTCQKRLLIPAQSRVRLFLLGRSIDSAQQVNMRLLNQARTLPISQLIDLTVTNNEVLEIDLRTSYLNAGQFILFYQVDSLIRPSASVGFAERQQSNSISQRGKAFLRRNWGILFGLLISFLLLIILLLLILLVLIPIVKRRRARAFRFSKNVDEHRQHLNPSIDPHDRTDHLRQPHLVSSSPVVLPTTSVNHQQRPQSASSTASGNEGLSDREALIKPAVATAQPTRAPTEIDNFYEEIKEQQQQTALALSMNGSKGDSSNPYLEAKYFEQPPEQPLFQGHPSSQAIRDHHEPTPHYQHPSSSIPEEVPDVAIKVAPPKRQKKPPPKIPPLRQDLPESIQPSAPPLHPPEQDSEQ